MAISTNSIIHYTKSIGILKLILKEGFKLKYCDESLKLKDGSSAAAHPMVSFCDIPLSESQKHFESYGHYGIGLTKEWAVKNEINPVLYIDSNSLVAENLSNLIKERRNSESNLTTEQKSMILSIKSYSKNYTGSYKKDGKSIKNYKFYDEREWRIVPNKEVLNGNSFSLNPSAYRKDKDKYNGDIQDIRIVFQHIDISYIIVEKTSQIPEIIKAIKENFSDNCTANQLDILVSKVCSAEQIRDDY